MKLVLLPVAIGLVTAAGCATATWSGMVRSQFDHQVGTSTYEQIKQQMAQQGHGQPVYEMVSTSRDIIKIHYGPGEHMVATTTYQPGGLFQQGQYVTQSRTVSEDGYSYTFAFDKKDRLLRWYVFEKRSYGGLDGYASSGSEAYKPQSGEVYVPYVADSGQQAIKVVPGSGAQPHGPTGDAESELDHKLDKIKRLRDQGEIDEAEYKRLRTKLLEGYTESGK